jgi:hypothetical protein
MNERAEGHSDGQRDRLRNGMRDRHGLDAERADLERVASLVDRDGYLRRPGLADSLGFQKACRERAHPDRDLQLRPDVQHRAVVVLVSVRDDHPVHAVDLALDEARVRQDQIDARKRQIGKRHAAVDDDPFALRRRAEAVEREVHADLAHAAKRAEDQFVAFGGRHSTSRPIRLAWWLPRRNARHQPRSQFSPPPRPE